MTTPFARAAQASVFVTGLALSGIAQAQPADSGRGGLLDNLFGGNESSRGASASPAPASDTNLVVRINRLENHIRQLTGAIEELQYRNQQLEQALLRMQGDSGYRFQGLGPRSNPDGQGPVAQQPESPRLAPSAAQAAPPQLGRRSDVFDPTQHPNAPGAPRPLGSGLVIAAPEPGAPGNVPPVGIAGGREAGAPLDLSTVARPGFPSGEAPGLPGVAGPDPTRVGGLPAPPPRNTSATGVMAAVQAPSQSPRDEYDLAYGYLLRKDYALAETAFRNFLKEHPGDRRVAEATYWLAESMFQRQQYRDAAESFLTVTTKHEKSSKAPEALYRLGQALAALGETEAACAALGEVARKYPSAPAGVKQGVEREQKRVRC